MSSLKSSLGENNKFILLAVALLAISMIILFAMNKGLYNPSIPVQTYSQAEQFIEEGVDYQITVKTVYGNINIDLYEQKAPENVNSLLFLISKRYYEDLTFHRVIKDFVIQAGDTKGDGTGNPGYSVSLENTQESFLDYTVGMANASQFFIVLPNSDKTDFNGKFTPIGRVTTGFAVVDSIAKVEVDENYKPLNDVVIESIQITEQPATGL
jgi:peptidyl-prolyl cis-trans isomerase B (cyclophilin B)